MPKITYNNKTQSEPYSSDDFNSQDANEIKASVNAAYDALEGKVDKEAGKGLSKNDFTDADKAKLNLLETGFTASNYSTKTEADSKYLSTATTIDAKFKTGFTVNLPDNRTGIANGTVVNAGDFIEPFLKAAFRKASPAVYSQPSASISANQGTGSIETGTIFSTLTLTGTFNKGDAGNKTSDRIIKNGATLSAGTTATETNVQITENTISYQYEVSYGIGGINNDSLGTPDASGQIQAGAKISSSISYTGYRKAFIGFSDADARSFPYSIFNPSNGSSLTITVPAGATKVKIVYPASLRNLTSVLYVQDSNKNIIDNFSASSNTDVAGANNYSPIAYKVYSFTPVEPFPSAVNYTVTI